MLFDIRFEHGYHITFNFSFPFVLYQTIFIEIFLLGSASYRQTAFMLSSRQLSICSITSLFGTWAEHRLSIRFMNKSEEDEKRLFCVCLSSFLVNCASKSFCSRSIVSVAIMQLILKSSVLLSILNSSIIFCTVSFHCYFLLRVFFAA